MCGDVDGHPRNAQKLWVPHGRMGNSLIPFAFGPIDRIPPPVELVPYKHFIGTTVVIIELCDQTGALLLQMVDLLPSLKVSHNFTTNSPIVFGCPRLSTGRLEDI